MKFLRTKGNKKLDLKTMPALLFCENSFVSSPHLNHSVWQSPLFSDRIPPVLLQPINPLCPISPCVSGLHQAVISSFHPHSEWFSSLNQQSNTGSKGCTLMVKKKRITFSKYKHNPSQKNHTVMIMLVMKQ